jgi:hypothetical protein
MQFDLAHLAPTFAGSFIPLVIIAAFVLVIAVAISLSGRTRWLSHITRKALLTSNEIEFFHRLQRALPKYQVFPQVSFAAFLTDDGKLRKKSRWYLRARFDRKIADFVICERGSLKVIALIELDDRSHNARADRQRDAITNAAGYQTFRFQSKQKPSEQALATLFQHADAWQAVKS